MERTFGVILSRKGNVDAALTALAKRAARKGIPGVLTWSWGKAYTDTAWVPNPDGVRPCADAYLAASCDGWIVPVTRVPLTITGETPRLSGWKFVACLQHLDGENITRVLPGETIPAEYRTRGSMCDHCHALRRRNDTYVLRHEDGRVTQVGSTCIKDFLGGDDAAIIAAKAEILALAGSVADMDDDPLGGSGGAPSEMLIADYLPYVAWVVRVEGWVSRTAARERDQMTASADRAWTLSCSAEARIKAECEFTDEDTSLATDAAAWAEALTDEAVDSEAFDYLHNLRAVARTGLVSFRTAGICASAVTAYQRHIGRERLKAERAARPTLDAYLGQIGDKVSFGLPAKVGKKGQPLKGAPVVLRAEPVTLDFVAGYESTWGYTTVLKFRTADGATVVWKASDCGITRSDVGKAYTIVGTIKAHDEYKGQKQTVLTRCTAEPVEAAGEAA